MSVAVVVAVVGGPLGGGVAVSVVGAELAIAGGGVIGLSTGFGRGAGDCGRDPAIVPEGIVDVDMVFGRVKFVVVSTAVLVAAVRGGISPGAAIVELVPLADPSSTTSYCC